MRHMVDGRKFGRNSSHRVAMFKSMANNLILNEQIITTVPKAKELRRVVDRLVTLGKKGSLHARRLAFGRTRNRDSVEKLFGPLAERFAKRAGGYTRVLLVDDTRWGDGADMAMIELVDRPITEKKKKAKKSDKTASDQDHNHDAEPKKKASFSTSGKGKVSEASSKSKSVKSAGVRKTPTKSGGSRSGSSSS